LIGIYLSFVVENDLENAENCIANQGQGQHSDHWIVAQASKGTRQTVEQRGQSDQQYDQGDYDYQNHDVFPSNLHFDFS
jgi:hypothetical protein